MYDRGVEQGSNTKNFVAVGVIIVVVIVIVVFASGILTRTGIVSPVPESDTVRVIFITPGPSAEASESGEVDDEVGEEDTDEENFDL